MKQFILAALLLIGSVVSLAGGAWVARASAVEEGRVAADNLLGDLQSTNYSLLSGLH